MLPQTMKALEIPALDGPGAARLVETRPPELQSGQVLIKVAAAGLNFADTMQTRGLYVGGPKAPYIAGIEAAGDVVAVAGDGRWKVGDRVMGFGGRGFAEYVAWPASLLLPVPESWTMTRAASFPVQWLTAHACLRTCGRLKAGESVLIHAAAGGVGIAAVRLARHYGARVFATASTSEKLEYARQHGADELINYSEQNFVDEILQRTDGRGVDLILEMIGGRTFKRNGDAVRPFGRIVVYGCAGGKAAGFNNIGLIFKPMEFIGYHLSLMLQKRPDLFVAQLAEINRLIADGVIDPDEPTCYPLADGAQAMVDMEARKTRGKLVLIP